MQPPTLKCQPPLQNRRFNDQEMVVTLNERACFIVLLLLGYDYVLKAKTNSSCRLLLLSLEQLNILTHKSNGSFIKKSAIPFSDVMNQAYKTITK